MCCRASAGGQVVQCGANRADDDGCGEYRKRCTVGKNSLNIYHVKSSYANTLTRFRMGTLPGDCVC